MDSTIPATKATCFLSLALLSFGPACNTRVEPPGSTPQGTLTVASEPASGDRDNPHAPPGADERLPPTHLTQTGEAGGATWEAPAAFRPVAPKTAMRVAEYEFAPDGSDTLATLSVFAGLGGGVQENVSRWVAQFQNTDNPNAAAESKVQARIGYALPVTTVFARGAFSVSPMMGGTGQPEAGMALLGAIVESPEGLVFFKLTGHESVVKDAEGPFDVLLQSIRPRASR